MAITIKLVKKINDYLAQGLSHGGHDFRRKGRMCIEEVVCAALGEPHSDHPSCVIPMVRRDKIALNDLNWSSKRSRAEGLKYLAVAQLDSMNNSFDNSRYEEYYSQYKCKIVLPYLITRLNLEPFLKKGALSLLKKTPLEKIYHLRIPDQLLESNFAEDSSILVNDLVRSFFTEHCSSPDEFDCYIVQKELKENFDDVYRKFAEAMLCALKKAKSPGCKFLKYVS